MDDKRELRKIDLNLLLVFEAVYKARSISQAAKVLGMGQPTVSNSLSRLRAQFDDRLFVRGDGAMRPTPLAESLANPIGDALATLRAGLKADEDFDVRTAQRHFRLILHDFSVPVILPPLLELFDRPDSSSKIEVVTPDWAKPHDALRSGEVDISVDIYPIETPGVNCVPLTKVMPVCIAREGHPTIAQSISRDQFMAAGHVVLGHNAQARIQVASVLLAAGVARREVCLVPNAADLATVVATTDLIAMVPERYGMRVAPIHRLQLVPLPFDFPAITLFISCREDKLAEPGLQWIRNAIMDILDE